MGNGIRFLQERQKLFAWFSRCEQLFGYETLQISVPSLPPGVIISDPKNLDFVFKNESIFAKGEFFKSRSWDLFGTCSRFSGGSRPLYSLTTSTGNGIINVDGDLWRLQRKAGLSFLSAANVRTLTADVLPLYIAEGVHYLMERLDGTVVDLQYVFHEITTQLMGNMAYNVSQPATGMCTVCGARKLTQHRWRCTQTMSLALPLTMPPASPLRGSKILCGQ